MKRFIFISFAAVSGLGFLFALNCSQPLDINDLGHSGLDTIYVQDTVVYGDTVYVDSVRVDTVYFDTLYADTLLIDTTLCARLDSHRQEIVWLMFNPGGEYQLEFRASPEQRRFPPSLIVDIDDNRYQWDLNDDLEFEIGLNLGRHAEIRINSSEPHAFGHAVDICLLLNSR